MQVYHFYPQYLHIFMVIMYIIFPLFLFDMITSQIDIWILFPNMLHVLCHRDLSLHKTELFCTHVWTMIGLTCCMKCSNFLLFLAVLLFYSSFYLIFCMHLLKWVPLWSSAVICCLIYGWFDLLREKNQFTF